MVPPSSSAVTRVLDTKPYLTEPATGGVMRPSRMYWLALGAMLLAGCGSAATPSASATTIPPMASPSAEASAVAAPQTATPSASSASGWHRVQGLPQSVGGALRDVVATGSGFAAVGSSGVRGPGAAWTSADGTVWQATPGQAALTSMPLEGVVATGTGLTAFGFPCPDVGECVTAAEVTFGGSAWSQAPAFVGAEGAEPARFAKIGERLVGVGFAYATVDPVAYAGRVWTSPTGITWTQVPDAPVFAKAQINDVAVGPHGLVAVGSAQTGSELGTDAAVWTSPDGLHWTRLASQPDFADAAMNAIVVSGSGLVAVGQGALGAAVWTSADGSHWARVADAPSLHDAVMHGVVSLASSLLAVGYGHDSAAIWTSPDATTWTRVPDGPTFAMAQAVAVAAKGGDVVVVGGANGETSPAAIIWTNH